MSNTKWKFVSLAYLGIMAVMLSVTYKDTVRPQLQSILQSVTVTTKYDSTLSIPSSFAPNSSVDANSSSQQQEQEQEQHQLLQQQPAQRQQANSSQQHEQQQPQQEQLQQQQQQQHQHENNVTEACNQTHRKGFRRSFGDPPPPLDGVAPNLTSTHLDRIIIIPEYKLMFCYIEKVGCAMFNNVFRILRLYAGNLTQGQAQQQANGLWFRNTHLIHNLTKSDLQEMLVDEEWTKAVFYREPSSRFLSAFANKCLNGENGKFNFCKKTFGQRVDFATAVQRLARRAWTPDAHFMPAGRLCGGLFNTLDYYDYVQPLRRETAQSDVQTLLTHVGVPERIQEKVLPLVPAGGRFEPEIKQEIESMYSGLVVRQNVALSHDTNVNAKREAFYSPAQLKEVQKFYTRDYDLFQLPIDRCAWENKSKDTL